MTNLALRFAVFALSALASAALSHGCSARAADPAVKLPAEVRVKPGRMVRLQAETTGKYVAWLLCNPEDADLIPIASEKAAIFGSPTPGRYRIFCYTAAGDKPSEPAVCVVNVGDAPKPPPGPDPPEPKPPPPEPSDPFAKALQAAFTADPSINKAKELGQLASLYRYAASLAEAPGEINTVGKLYEVLAEAGRILVGKGVLEGVRKVIAAELDRMLPTDPAAPLDAATQGKCAAQFRRVAKALEGVR